MDRRQLLDRAAQSGEERVLLAHILDKCEQSRQRNIPAATDFLSPAEQRAAQEATPFAAVMSARSGKCSFSCPTGRRKRTRANP